jgi:hypothetical protein
MGPKPIEFVDGVYSEDFDEWTVRAIDNPLGPCSVIASDSVRNRVVLDSDGDFVIDARCVPIALIERMAYVWRALGGS